MKKVFGFVLLLVVVGVSSGFCGQRYSIKESDSTLTVFKVKSTLADTSQIYATQPIMTVFGVVYDDMAGVATDSVNITLTFQVWSVKGWTSFKTKTITTDSTEFYWMITDTPCPSSRTYRVIATGNSGNQVNDYNDLYLTMDGGNGK